MYYYTPWYGMNQIKTIIWIFISVVMHQALFCTVICWLIIYSMNYYMKENNIRILGNISIMSVCIRATSA